jgi:hypothetical protein
MLGELRTAAERLAPELELDTLPRDLVKLSPLQLRNHLAQYGLLPLPPRRRHANA